MSSDPLKSRSSLIKRDFIRPRSRTDNQCNRLSLSLRNTESNADITNKVALEEDKSSVLSSSNSISKTYGQLSSSSDASAPSSAVDGAPQESLHKTATPNRDDLGALSRKAFVKQLAIAAVCAALLDFAVRADRSAGTRSAHVIHERYAKKESSRPGGLGLAAHDATGAEDGGSVPVAAAIAQAGGAAALALGGSLRSILEVSVPFLAANVASPAAAKLAQLSADALPAAQQLAASASAVLADAQGASAALPSPADLPEGVRAALEQAFAPAAEQAAATAAAADAALRGAREAIVGQATQADPPPFFLPSPPFNRWSCSIRL
jgi:hypothetical protein